MALFVLCKLILQTHMRSHPVRLDAWCLVGPFVYFHTSCVRTAKALVRPDPTPFSITVRMHIRMGLNFLSSSGQLQPGMDLQPKLSLGRQWMGLSPKYNDLELGRDMACYACPWGLLVNSFNWGGFAKDLYCYLFLVFFFRVTYVPHPHLPSWSDMTECSIKRKKWCTGSPEPSLVAYVMNTIFSWAGSNKCIVTLL